MEAPPRAKCLPVPQQSKEHDVATPTRPSPSSRAAVGVEIDTLMEMDRDNSAMAASGAPLFAFLPGMIMGNLWVPF